MFYHKLSNALLQSPFFLFPIFIELQFCFGFSFQHTLQDIVKKVQGKLNVKFSPLIGLLEPLDLEKMVNLKSIDVFSCFLFDSRKFVKSIVKCLELETINMEGCFQFTKHQFIEMCTGLPNLKIVKAYNSVPIQSASAYMILTNCRKMEVFEVDPKFPATEVNNWARLKATFLGVDFGSKMKAMIARKK